MRKALVAFLVILLVFTSVYTYFAFDIGKENDNVTFTETILQGDKAFAEGITVETSYQYNQRLFWDSELVLGDENKAETEFTFHKRYTYEDIEHEGSLTFYTEASYSSSQSIEDFTKDISELEGLARAYKELYDTAEPGQTARKIIVYKDYMGYYPIAGDCDAKDEFISFGAIYDILADERSLEVQAKLEEYFKIPIIDEECREIHLQKDYDGSLVSIGSSQIDEDADSYNFYSECAESEKGLYVVFSNRTTFGEIVDTSLIPGGYGIYFFPYKENIVDFDNIQTVYPVDEKNEIIHISTDKDKTKLHLITKEKDKIILNVIDIETMALVQRVELHTKIRNNYEEDYFGIEMLETDKDFIVYEIYDSSSYLCVVAIDEKNLYTKSLKIKNDLSFWNADFEWDGEYLYAADYQSNHGTIMGTTPRLYVGIIGNDGVKFHASYNTSLNTGESFQYMSSYYCFSNTNKPIISLRK